MGVKLETTYGMRMVMHACMHGHKPNYELNTNSTFTALLGRMLKLEPGIRRIQTALNPTTVTLSSW